MSNERWGSRPSIQFVYWLSPNIIRRGKHNIIRRIVLEEMVWSWSFEWTFTTYFNFYILKVCFDFFDERLFRHSDLCGGVISLEHIFFKNVSKGPAFSRPTQIQTLEYGLDDAMRIRKKDLVLIEYSFTSSDMNFQTIWMAKGILTKIWSRNSWSLVTILIWSMP